MAEACLPTATLSQMFEAKTVSAIFQNIIVKLLQKVQTEFNKMSESSEEELLSSTLCHTLLKKN